MDFFKLKIVKILLELRIPLYKNILVKNFKNSDEIIAYVFNNLTREDASVFYYKFLEMFPDTYIELLLPHFKLVINSIEFPVNFINKVATTYGPDFMNNKLDDIASSLKKSQYNEIMIALYENNDAMKHIIRNLGTNLFQFYDALISSKKEYEYYFLDRVLFPMCQYGLVDYFQNMNNLLFNDKSLDIEFLNWGSSSFTFDVNGIIIKLGNTRHRFPIIMHYRMNEFYVRKEFSGGNGHIYLEASPKGDVSSVTRQDIEDAIKDLKAADIVVTDMNYAQNFALFDNNEKIKPIDVDGIIEVRDREFSDSYQKRKVKLIDHDYIYDVNEKEKYWVRDYNL